MTKHTPGPWHVAINGVDVQAGPTGCLAYVSTAGARGRTLEEAEANARLIAAAPTLLAACKLVLEPTVGETWEEMCDQLRAAIALAE